MRDNEHLRELVKSYGLVQQGYRQRLNIDLERLAPVFEKEVTNISHKAKNELLSSLRGSLTFGTPLDFPKLKAEEVIRIPRSTGVSYEGLAYIAKWNVVAFGSRDHIDSRQYSIGLYDLVFKKTLSVVRCIHKGMINNVLWIDHKNYLLTGSDDFSIRVFRASNEGRNLQAIRKFRGHTDCVRLLSYIEDENILVSAGYDINIKLWSIDNFKRCGTISTNSEGDISGSLAYIKADRLIGVPFQSGFIRFYHLGSRSLVFQLHIGTSHTISLCGLQYLSQKKVIVTNTSRAEL